MPLEITGWTEETNDEYHADKTHVSHSMLKMYGESPPKYQAANVTKTFVKETNDHLEFGTAFHTIMLEPDRFAQEYAVTPERWKQNTKEGKENLAKFTADNPGKIILWPEDFAALDGMSKAAYADPLISALLKADGLIEKSFRAVDPNSGLKTKCKPDRLFWFDFTEGTALTFLDLKAMADATPFGFRRAAANFGYHRQAAFYPEVVKRAAGLPDDIPVRFLFLVCGKPFPQEARIIELSERFLSIGRQENARDLSRLAASLALNEWQGDGFGEVTTIEPPGWLKGDDDEAEVDPFAED